MGRAPDLLFSGGRVWTGAAPTTAVAVSDGRIVAIGDDAMAARGPTTDVVDLRGRTLLPGFRDGHVHPLDGGAETLACDLVDAVDVADVLARVRSYARAHPGPGWIVGYGFPPEVLPGGVGRAEVLDHAEAGRPVALWSSDHHMVWVNRRALEIAGITRAVPDPPRGTIVRDPDGEPVGMLLEEAERLLDGHVPARGLDQQVRGLEVGLERMAAAGLVWLQDAWSTPATLAAYHHVADRGGLTADVDVALEVEPDRWPEQVAVFDEVRRDAERAAARRDRDGVPGGRLTVRTVKIFVDGVIEGGTGALLEPYCAIDGLERGHHHGIMNWGREDLLAAAAAFDAAGLDLHMHAIGDAAVRLALDVVAWIRQRNGPRDRRPVVAHTHLVHPDDVPRFAEVGAIANFEPLWAQPNEIMTRLTEPRLGADRSAWQYPIGSVLRTGAHVSFGSDWPVSSHVPLAGVAVAVTRQTPTGEPEAGWLSDERLTVDQALRAYTAGTAHQARLEHVAGTIEVGMAADLVVAGADLAETPAGELAAVPIEGTWLRGRRVWTGAG